MKIIDIQNDLQNGCYWLRNKLPFDSLKNLGIEHEIAQGQVKFDDYDAVSFSRLYHGNFEDMVNKIIAHGYIKKVPIIYDNDDACDLVVQDNINYNACWTAMASYFYFLNIADLVTTTTPALAEYFKSRGAKRVEVIPNCLNPKDWKLREGNKGNLRIGFVGSLSHLGDVVPLMESVAELHKTYDFTFVFAGFAAYPDTAEEFIEQGFNSFPKGHPFTLSLEKFKAAWEKIKDFSEWHHNTPIQVYPRNLAKLNLDIGCCPLAHTEFNKYKSAVKFYEYAMCGTLCLAENWGPFSTESNEPTVLLDMAHLESLLENPQMIKSAAEHQHKWVMENRTLEIWAKKRAEIYKSFA